MASVTETPGLTGEEASFVFGVLDIYFNEIIVNALTHGMFAYVAMCSVADLTCKQGYIHASSLSPCGTSVSSNFSAPGYCYFISLNPYTVSSKTQRSASRNLMVLAITALYILSTISFGFLWFFVRFGFINNGQNALTVFEGFEASNSQHKVVRMTLGITGIMSTFIADAAMVRRSYNY